MADAEAAATHPDHGQAIPTAKSIPDGGKVVDPIDRYTALAVRVRIGNLKHQKTSPIFNYLFRAQSSVSVSPVSSSI